MSRADDLLNDLTDEELLMRTTDEAKEPNVVIGDDRFITVPDVLKKVAVQYDHRIETVTFDCPRYWDGADMSKMAIYIHYTRVDGLVGMYLAKNVVADEKKPNIMHFDWTLSRNVTGISGPLQFLVSINKVDKKGNITQYWSSELNADMYISPGMDNAETVQDKYPDIFTRMLQEMDATVDTNQTIKDSAVAELTKIKNTAVSETTAIKVTTQSIKDSAVTELTKIKNETVSQTTAIKDSAIAEMVNTRKNMTDTFAASIEETRNILSQTEEFIEDTQEMMDNTNTLHNETLEWVKQITDIATPEAMKEYAYEYYSTNPTAVLDAIDDIYSLATETDIDGIISGNYVPGPNAYEEEFSLATDADIDAILSGAYAGGDGSSGSDPGTASLDQQLDNIVNNSF